MWDDWAVIYVKTFVCDILEFCVKKIWCKIVLIFIFVYFILIFIE